MCDYRTLGLCGSPSGVCPLGFASAVRPGRWEAVCDGCVTGRRGVRWVARGLVLWGTGLARVVRARREGGRAALPRPAG